ncbi:MAG: RelA/SpoT family protein [Candidatus Gracilibacteria bacterium]|nr:RelA/SpoT family protein [Candidatus Gracilibacteria bacterium]
MKFEKMFIAMAEDLRVVFIKLSDRIHNMKTLKFHPKREKQIKIATETLNIYAPIADRLGLFGIKNTLEEECFKILDKKDYQIIKKDLKEIKEGSKIFLEEAKEDIKKLLDEAGIINYKIDYRVKSIYSIYKKMKKKGLEDIKSLYDLFGLRIVVNDVEECYKTLGMLHNKWSPLPSRFKDYIALPKPNGYKALHTTVVGLLNKNKKQPAEIQIKTSEMVEYAEIGVAAHFEYKEKGSHIAEDINWVKELKEVTENLGNNDFISSLKIDIFSDRIFVFTPKGDSLNLPHGSTAIDFAYNLHSDLGDHISIAKVNGKIYPLDKELKNGDIIEIIIDKNRKPNPFWLSFIKTSKAKSRIKSFLKKENRDQHRERGKDIINKFLEKSGLDIFDKDLSILKNLDGRTYKIEERWALLEQVGNFSISPSSIMRKILNTLNINQVDRKRIKNKEKYEEKINEINKKKEEKIIVGGDKDIKYIKGNCVKRKMPEKIVGHINSKGIITIHKRDCKTLDLVNKERLLPAYLESKKENIMSVKLWFEVKDGVGILYSITKVIMNMNINIEEIHQTKSDSGNKAIEIIVEILDYDYLLIDRLINRIQLQLLEKLLKKEVVEIKG